MDEIKIKYFSNNNIGISCGNNDNTHMSNFIGFNTIIDGYRGIVLSRNRYSIMFSNTISDFTEGIYFNWSS